MNTSLPTCIIALKFNLQWLQSNKNYIIKFRHKSFYKTKSNYYTELKSFYFQVHTNAFIYIQLYKIFSVSVTVDKMLSIMLVFVSLSLHIVHNYKLISLI